MLLESFHHLAVICSNYQKSKVFYTNILGCKIIRETYRAERNSYKLDLQIANSQIELFSFSNPPKRLSMPEACGLRHIAFTVEDMEEVVRQLKLQQIEVEEVRTDELTGKFFTFFKDPDGLPIEICEK